MDKQTNLYQYDLVEKLLISNMNEECIKLDKQIEKQKKAISKLNSLAEKVEAGRNLNTLRKQAYVLRSTLFKREDIIKSCLNECKSRL